MEKNKIISLSTTLLYSFVLVISFLCFYHSIVESSWLLEIIVSLFVLIGVNLLSYKTKTKEIIFPIVMTFIIGIIYSFQSFYYGFWGIINYCIQWYNVQFDDARNLMMTKAITTSHIQAFSLVVILFITYFIYRSIKKEKMMGIILIFSIVFAFTLWIDRFSFIGGSLCIITLLMIWMYYQNKVINSKTVQWLVIISIIFVAVALPVYQDNLSLQQIKKEVLQQVEDLRYGKDNLPQGNLKQASIIHENEEERLQLAVSQRKNLYLKGFVGSTLQNNQFDKLEDDIYQKVKDQNIVFNNNTWYPDLYVNFHIFPNSNGKYFIYASPSSGASNGGVYLIYYDQSWYVTKNKSFNESDFLNVDSIKNAVSNTDQWLKIE